MVMVQRSFLVRLYVLRGGHTRAGYWPAATAAFRHTLSYVNRFLQFPTTDPNGGEAGFSSDPVICWRGHCL